MKIMLLAALTALPFLSRAQTPDALVPFPDNGIYLTAADFTHQVLTDGFDTGQPGYRLHDETFRAAVKLTQPTAKSLEIPAANLWGERLKDVDYRRVDGELYRVEHSDRIFVYSKPTMFGQFPRSLYYFSRTADSPIYLITAENLENMYYDQPEKKAFFEDLASLSDHPAQQALKLTQRFYTDGLPAQSAASAD